MWKSILLWVGSFIFMGLIAVFQRMTGPTYPVQGKVEIGNQMVKYSLPRSHDGSGKELIKIKVPDTRIKGEIKLKRYKSYDEWQILEMARAGADLLADIPEQAPAGKVMYQITLIDGNKRVELRDEPVIIRFKGYVPEYFLYPHIFFMFCAMWFSTRAGLEALTKGKNVFKISLWTLILLFAGGIILGPIIQWYAFGALWTGWPFGHDLTDNKTLAAFIMWIIAVLVLRKNPNKIGWAIAASLVLLAVYLVPHSVLGSEIDYTKMPQQ